jgi:hypothetical protein
MASFSGVGYLYPTVPTIASCCFRGCWCASLVFLAKPKPFYLSPTPLGELVRSLVDLVSWVVERSLCEHFKSTWIPWALLDIVKLMWSICYSWRLASKMARRRPQAPKVWWAVGRFVKVMLLLWKGRSYLVDRGKGWMQPGFGRRSTQRRLGFTRWWIRTSVKQISVSLCWFTLHLPHLASLASTCYIFVDLLEI